MTPRDTLSWCRHSVVFLELKEIRRAKVRFAANGDVSLWLARNQGATETILATQATSGFTYAAGDKVNIRTQVFGTTPTTIRRVPALTDPILSRIAWRIALAAPRANVSSQVTCS